MHSYIASPVAFFWGINSTSPQRHVDGDRAIASGTAAAGNVEGKVARRVDAFRLSRVENEQLADSDPKAFEYVTGFSARTSRPMGD